MRGVCTCDADPMRMHVCMHIHMHMHMHTHAHTCTHMHRGCFDHRGPPLVLSDVFLAPIGNNGSKAATFVFNVKGTNVHAHAAHACTMNGCLLIISNLVVRTVRSDGQHTVRACAWPHVRILYTYCTRNGTAAI